MATVTLTEVELQEIMSKIGKIDIMEQSLQVLSNKYDELTKEYHKLKNQHSELEKDHKALKSQVLKSEKVITMHSQNINDLEQYSRRECLEIRGIPVTQDESTDEIVGKVGEIIGVDIDADDISISHRLADKVITRSDGVQMKRDPAIIVKFTHRTTRDDFYRARKKLHKRSTKDLGFTRQRENPIFISESLTARNRMIFNRCLEFKKKNYFKFIWTHYGTTFLRKDTNSSVIVIKTEDDIKKYLNS